jgi:hypothetical protein
LLKVAKWFKDIIDATRDRAEDLSVLTEGVRELKLKLHTVETGLKKDSLLMPRKI